MKRSKRCPLCQISEHDHERLMTQVKLLGSRAKGFSWFCEEYPSSGISEHQFFNHFRRHVEESDFKEIELVPKNQMVDPKKLSVVVFENEGVAIDPEVQISSLHLELLKELDYILKNRDRVENFYNTMLSFFKEARMQIDLIDKLKLKAPSTAGKKFENFKKGNVSKTVLAAIEIDPKKAPKSADESEENTSAISDQ